MIYMFFFIYIPGFFFRRFTVVGLAQLLMSTTSLQALEGAICRYRAGCEKT